MHITMIKKQLLDGSECRKCADATAQLEARGHARRIDEVVWADERDPHSPGMKLAAELGVDSAPFFLVRDSKDSPISSAAVYTSVLKLIREHLDAAVSRREEAGHIDIDDVGGI